MARNISYRQAINEALHQEMEYDKNVFIYGIDVADHKSIFGSTEGLKEKFGDMRCFSTPLSEDAFTGFGLGAALNGLRPIHVHMRVDFMLLAMNQLMNMVSSFTYGSGGKLLVPLVIRAIIGRGWGQAYQHSKSIQSVFAHFPGLIVVMPATPKEAKGLLAAAIRCDSPVIVLEHRWLYDVEGDVPEELFVDELEKASILKRGEDVTIVATSWMNVEAMQAAEILKRANIDAEVINARCISSIDPVIEESVKNTGHCVIVDNDWSYCGFSAELVATLQESCFRYCKTPITRVGFAHTPCPCTRPLENCFYPNARDIVDEVTTKLWKDSIDMSGDNFYSYENKFKGPF